MKKILLVIGFLLLVFGLVFGVFETPLKYVLQSKAYLESGKVAKAIKILEQGISKYPDNKKLTFNLARAYNIAGETEIASKKLFSQKTIQLLEKEKGLKDFLVDLAEANHNLGNDTYAQFFAEQFLSYKNNLGISRKTVKNLLRVGQILPDKSIELWEQSYNIANAVGDEDSKQSLRALLLPKYFRVVDECIVQGQYNDALDTLDKSQVLGQCAEVEYKQAKLHLTLKQYDLALRHFDEALQLEPDNNNYKVSYADALKLASLNTKDKKEKSEHLERAKLLLSGSTDPKQTSLLKKILNLNAKYKVVDSKLQLKTIGDYSYPTLVFKIVPVSDIKLKKYKIIFFDDNKNKLDEHEDVLTRDELNQSLELTSKIPVGDDILVSAKLYLNDELVKELTVK